jgi:hypothetical protein
MAEQSTFALTLVRVGPSLPYIDADLYEYVGGSLPAVGDTITVRKIAGRDGGTLYETRAYVTRVDGNAKPPLRATEVQADTGDDTGSFRRA